MPGPSRIVGSLTGPVSDTVLTGPVERLPMPPRVAALPPLRAYPIPNDRLQKGEKGESFNGGVIPYKGKRLLGYRTGWNNADSWACEVGDDLRPVTESVRIPLDRWCEQANHGRDDPRLFVFRDKLHLSLTAHQKCPDGSSRTHVGYARLGDDYHVQQVYYPDYAQRVWPYEKNWQFFECDGDLYCVYSIRPHVVLKLDGYQVVRVYWTNNPFGWGGGLTHGGAPPVRVGDEYYHWFHGLCREGDWHTYSIGVYCFEAKPPFRITRFSMQPLLWASPEGRPAGQGYDVIFPTAAYLDGGKWVVSGGVHDRSLAVWEWDAVAVDRLLSGIAATP